MWSLLSFTLVALGQSVTPATATASTDGWTDRYAGLLVRYTEAVDAKVGTRVDYAGLRGEPEWKTLIAELATVDPAALKGRDDVLAFWINAYNIFAIDLIVRNPPVESIKDLGSFFSPVWKKEAGRLADRSYTLDEIEHRILRKMGEPRIHGAIVCASISCPNLRREPYLAERLDAQLADNMRAWLARPEKGLSIDRAGNALRISPIFDWFEADFATQGGVMAVVTRYAPEADHAWLAQHGTSARIGYFDYDWRLND
jgi:hypothetical protein